MSDKSAIEWTDASWNPIRGESGRHTCARISPGCDHCYAATMNRRGLGGTAALDYGRGERLLDAAYLDAQALLQPLRWRRPRSIFVCSMTDLGGTWVPDWWLDAIWAVMAVAPQHTFQVLTKRPGRLRRWFESDPYPRVLRYADQYLYAEQYLRPRWPKLGDVPISDPARIPYPHVWIGVSVESDGYAWRANVLRSIPAAVRWISAEPLLGGLPSLDLGGRDCLRCGGTGTTTIRHLRTNHVRCNQCDGTGKTIRISWLVAGGESGAKARPMHPDWARDLRGRCHAAGIPFFFKQWGEWTPVPPVTRVSVRQQSLLSDGTPYDSKRPEMWHDPALATLYRVGKRAAGRLLDGRTWDELPAPRVPAGV